MPICLCQVEQKKNFVGSKIFAFGIYTYVDLVDGWGGGCLDFSSIRKLLETK